MALPSVTVKYASTLDGRIATRMGESKWISGNETLKLAHQLRAEHEAILVGIGTVLADDPQLTVRLVEGSDPLRVIVDAKLQTPLTARVLTDGNAENTLIAATGAADEKRLAEIRNLGAGVLILPGENGNSRVNLEVLFAELGRRSVKSVLVEGGSQIITTLLAARLADRLIVVIAPKIIGRGIEAVGDLGITRLSEAITFTSVQTTLLGTDVVFDCRLR